MVVIDYGGIVRDLDPNVHGADRRENTGNKRGHSSGGSTGLKRGHSC